MGLFIYTGWLWLCSGTLQAFHFFNENIYFFARKHPSSSVPEPRGAGRLAVGACPPAAQGGTKPRAGQSWLRRGPRGRPSPCPCPRAAAATCAPLAGVEGMETPGRESWGVPRPWGKRGVQGVPGVRRGEGCRGGAQPGAAQPRRALRLPPAPPSAERRHVPQFRAGWEKKYRALRIYSLG